MEGVQEILSFSQRSEEVAIQNLEWEKNYTRICWTVLNTFNFLNIFRMISHIIRYSCNWLVKTYWLTKNFWKHCLWIFQYMAKKLYSTIKKKKNANKFVPKIASNIRTYTNLFGINIVFNYNYIIWGIVYKLHNHSLN